MNFGSIKKQPYSERFTISCGIAIMIFYIWWAIGADSLFVSLWAQLSVPFTESCATSCLAFYRSTRWPLPPSKLGTACSTPFYIFYNPGKLNCVNRQTTGKCLTIALSACGPRSGRRGSYLASKRCSAKPHASIGILRPPNNSSSTGQGNDQSVSKAMHATDSRNLCSPYDLSADTSLIA